MPDFKSQISNLRSDRKVIEDLFSRFWLKRIFLAIILFAAMAPAWAVERFPPPDLGADYVYPHSMQAPARLGWLAWLDLAALIGALIAATVIAHRRRSRRAMLWLSAGSLLYFGFYRKGCVCPIGAIQNVAQAAFDSSFVIPWVVLAFFALPLLFAIFVGRVFCGGVCPLGALQDLVLFRPVQTPRIVDRVLSPARHFYLGLAVLFAATGTSYLICNYDPMVSFFRLNARFEIWVWSGAVLLASLVIGRPYCRYLCPYGALLGLFSRFARRRVTTTPRECVSCGLCAEACDFGALRAGDRKAEDQP